MCLICVDFQKETLTITEAWRNLQEMKDSMTDEHYDEVVTMVVDKIYEEQSDEETSELWDAGTDEDLLSFLEHEEPELNFEDEQYWWSSDYLGYCED